MELMLCEKFPAFTPLSLRRERAREVFCMMTRMLGHIQRENKKWIVYKGKRMRKKEATDDTWF